MNKHIAVKSGVGGALLITLIIAFTLWVSINRSGVAEAGIDTHAFDAGEPGTYRFVMSKYTRHGPQAGLIAPNPRILFDKERVVLDVRWGALPDGSSVDVRYTITSSDGELLYALTENSGERFQIVDHRHGDKVVDGSPVLSTGSVPAKTDFNSVKARFLEDGFQQGRETIVQGRAAIPYTLVLSLDPQSEPPPGSYRFPVYYDLDVDTQTIIQYVDIESGLITRHERFASGSTQEPVLIESFEFMTFQKEQ